MVSEETGRKLAGTCIRFAEADEQLRRSTVRGGGGSIRDAVSEYLIARREHQEAIAEAEAEE